MRGVWAQLLRFGAVGLSCLALGLAILAGLHQLAAINYLVAYAASFVITNVAGYLLNARFTFAVSTVDRTGGARYMMVNAVALIVNTAAMKALVDGLHVWYLAAAVLLGAINTPVSFLAQRLITYRLTARGGKAAA